MPLIKKEDYLKRLSIDLEIDFRNGNYDSSNAVDEYFERVEEFTKDYLMQNYDNQSNFIDKLNEKELQTYKDGLIYQAAYFWEVGELYINNPNNLPLMNRMAFIKFRSIGLCNYRSF